MRRSSRLALLTAVIGLAVPVAISSSSASAVDQDLQASAVAGPPGTEIELTSASCTDTDPDDDTFVVLTAVLISGTAPDEVWAGAASSDGNSPAVLVVPDWIDPNDPAVIEASCLQVTFGPDGFDEQETPFDPIAFDVEASIDPPVQARTFSRTSLLAGQGFTVDGQGCFLSGERFAGVEVAEGADLSGRSLQNWVANGGNDVTGSDFSVDTFLSNGGFSYGFESGGGSPGKISDIEEYPTDIPAGAYTAVPYCANDAGSLLFFEPQVIDVTGDAPFGEADLAAAPNSRAIEFQGGACTAGPVDLEMYAFSADDLGGEPIFDQPAAPGDRAIRRDAEALAGDGGTKAATTSGVRRSLRGHVAGGPSATTRAFDSDGYSSATVDPSDQGEWAYGDEVTFDVGVVEGYAVCGDPLADGFLYDPQVAAVQVATQETTTTTTTTAPSSPPANAIPGNANYAG